ncbi:phage head protein [Salmonella enterica subsp. enterica serovar Yaba]|nr:phage head protein [Salmonella enterica subsp. enterica]EGG8165156.1 phage head protein [Salmonella enterica subsp. enterica serovar Yaba]
MPAVTIDSNVLYALKTSLSAAYTRGVGKVNPTYKKIATVVKSTGASNTYGWLEGWPGIKEWIDERQLATLTQMGYSVVNKTWETSIQVKREDIEDDQLGQYSVISEEFGRETTMFPDSLSYALLCKGFSSVCYDGQYFFDTDHPVGTATVSNVLGTGAETGEPWFLIDATHALLPIIFQDRRPFDFTALDDLSSEHVFKNNTFAFGTDGRCNVGFGFWQTVVGSKQQLNTGNFESAVKLLQSVPRTNGEPLGMNPSLLVVGKNNLAAAKTLLEAQVGSGGASNIHFKATDLLYSPYVK